PAEGRLAFLFLVAGRGEEPGRIPRSFRLLGGLAGLPHLVAELLGLLLLTGQVPLRGLRRRPGPVVLLARFPEASLGGAEGRFGGPARRFLLLAAAGGEELLGVAGRLRLVGGVAGRLGVGRRLPRLLFLRGEQVLRAGLGLCRLVRRHRIAVETP